MSTVVNLLWLLSLFEIHGLPLKRIEAHEIFFFRHFEEGGRSDVLIFIFTLNIKTNYIIGDDSDIDLYD